jgi:iron complex transport system permease protein
VTSTGTALPPQGAAATGAAGPGGVPGAGRAPRRSRRTAVRAAGFVVAVAVLGVVLVASIALGSRSIAPGTTWHLLWSPDGGSESVIIHDLRIPRTLLGLGVGAALGLSGALMQALTRNPLAEPGLLGVNLGASTGVVAAIAFLGVGTLTGYIWFAFAGAALTSAAVFLLGGTGRQPTPERQVLAGIAITAVLGAFVYGVIVTRREAFDRYRHWDVGSLADRESGVLPQVAPFLVAGILLALALGRSLDAMALGDESAASLGARPGVVRAVGFGAITLLCGAATAAAGPIWFLGLAVPHAARAITGPDQRWVLAYSLVLAPAILLAADVLGRILVAPAELPVGIVTAFLGAPVFLALCRRRRIAQL